LGFKDELLVNKLRVLRSSNPGAFETLKLLVKGAKGFERTALVKGISTDVISTLEKYELIFTYNFSDYVVLNNRIKSIIDKI
jgi:hypothetical protein